jgi:hypothetical protein
MSPQLIARSRDLKKLRDEGYDIEVVDGYLLMRSVPYVNAQRQIKYGVLVSTLTLANDTTATPDTHTALFAGEYPSHKDGSPIEKIRHSDNATKIGDITTSYYFSARPQPSGRYNDYYDKMSAYVNILSAPAQATDPNVTAKIFPVARAQPDESVFKYIDTASSRAEIVEVTKKLELRKIAIVGLGGTGAYVLDLVAKTPVREIHLLDGDKFLQHNAFRSPGAASGEDLEEKLTKVIYLERIYSKMRHGIIAHAEHVDGSNLDRLNGMDFVFLCMEGRAKKIMIERLEQQGTPFIDVGMGIYLRDGKLGGLVRTTTSINTKRDHITNRISFGDNDESNEYSSNIQIADLNALNAALAVIKWKKVFGFYLDQEQEHNSTYVIGGNELNNEDQS